MYLKLFRYRLHVLSKLYWYIDIGRNAKKPHIHLVVFLSLLLREIIFWFHCLQASKEREDGGSDASGFLLHPLYPAKARYRSSLFLRLHLLSSLRIKNECRISVLSTFFSFSLIQTRVWMVRLLQQIRQLKTSWIENDDGHTDAVQVFLCDLDTNKCVFIKNL